MPAGLQGGVLELIHAAAPRKGAFEIDLEMDLGFDGYRLTILEYLSLMDSVEERRGDRKVEQAWPHTVSELVALLEPR